MRIPRTNFPIKSDEYGFEDDFGEQPIRELVPLTGSAAPSLPIRPAPAGYSNPQYEPVIVRRPAIPPVQNRPAPAVGPPEIRPEQMNVDPSSAPISKRMFSLSENVRFTRTPDSELLKGKPDTNG